MKHKIIDHLIIVLFNLFLIIIAIWVAIIPIARSKSFFMAEYEKYNTVEESGYTTEQLSVITDKIIAYLFDETDDMQVEFNHQIVFSNQALYHMRDVKELFVKGQTLAWIILVLWTMSLVYLFLNYQRLKKYILKTSFFTIGLLALGLIAIGIWGTIDFSAAFRFFHHVIFPDINKFNDAFFGNTSNYPELPGVNNLTLVQILSNELFMDFGIIIAIVVFAFIIIWIIMMIILRKIDKKKTI